MPATAQTPPLVCRRISKRFGSVTALDNVDFTLHEGEVHGVVGSNGAGKSTLMKILAGVLPEHDGTVMLEGRPADLYSPQAAMAQGIAMVYQELSGIGQLSVAENLFLGRQPTTWFGRIDWRTMRNKARQYLAELQVDVDVTRPLDDYPLVVRQMVEIARGIHSGARVLILDEPTSALSPPETRRLFALIRRLRDRGVAVVFISHFIEDVLEICDRVTILCDGRRLETTETKKLDKRYVIRTMLGHGAEAAGVEATGVAGAKRSGAPEKQGSGASLRSATSHPESVIPQEPGYEAPAALPPRTIQRPVLAAEALGLGGILSGVNLAVSPGECLGLYGFVGAGHQELVHGLAGSLRPDTGRVLLDGRRLKPGSTHDAVRRGIVLVAADRAQSLFMQGEIYKNVTLAHLRRAIGEWLRRGKETATVEPLLKQVDCRPADPRMTTGNLSGGNQQKAVFARWLLGPVRVLLLDEPTRGMDVGAKDEVMRLVAALKRQGTAVVLSSAEPEMLLAHADRILVFSRGRITHEFADTRLDKPMLMRYA